MNDMATLVALQAGDHVMKVHASVLADNSDYFKAIMMSGRWPSTPLLVPFVHPKALVHLVQFMYSRHLDVDHQGVVQDVLLAARLLGMPKAVGACQDILAQQGLARPMPFPWIWTPAVMAPSWRPPMDMYRSEWAIGSLRAPTPIQLAPIQQPRDSSLTEPPPQATHATGTDTYCASSSAAATSTSQTMVLNDARPKETFTDNQDLRATPSPECSGHQNLSTSAATSPCPSIGQVKVVIDVAWCDGPVRFQRVLNDNCNLFACNDLDDPHVSKRSKKTSKRPSAPGHRPKTTTAEDGSVDNQEEQQATTLSCHQQSNYNCLYCNLSFKSHHCYVKHKRRHLNPCAVDCGKTVNSGKPTDSGKSLNQLQTDDPVAPKSPLKTVNEVETESSNVPSPKALSSPTTSRAPKSLELNVPFYPCKSCGSKFPSYYFVHKHSKVCHGVVIAQHQEGSGSD